MKKVAIILLNYKFENQTLECLDSLQDIDTSGIELTLYIVNNTLEGAFDIDHLKRNKLKEKIVIINNSKNLGFAGGMNTGITAALKNGNDYIMVLNNDTYVDPGFVRKLIIAIDKDNTIGAVSPKIYFAKGYEFHADRYDEKELGKVIWYAGGVMDWENVLASHRGVDEVDHGQYDMQMETDFLTGCCILFTREVLGKIGLFDERYFLYYEDNDISKRIKNGGFKVEYVPQSIIWHKNAGSTGGSGSQLQDYFITRNRMLFGITYASTRAKIALLKQGCMYLFIGRKNQKKGIIDFFRGKWGKGSL